MRFMDLLSKAACELLPDHSKLSRLQSACRQLVAKTDPDSPRRWLPLWMHMSDTAGTMLYLMERRMSTHLIRFLSSQLEEAGYEDGRNTLMRLGMLAGFLHDLGKASAGFQIRIGRKLEQGNPSEIPLPPFDPMKNDPDFRRHENLSLIILRSLGYCRGFASVAGAHHGRTQQERNTTQIKNFLSQLKATYPLYGRKQEKTLWQQTWEQISQSCLSMCGFENPQQIPALTQVFWLLLSGLVVEADWIASNTDYFPLIDCDSSGSPKDYPERWFNAWKTLGFPAIWHSPKRKSEENLFYELFELNPYPFQETLIETARTLSCPGLMIVEAEMGLGKTEAALAAAEILSSKCGSGGVYYGLPTQATANGLFRRFSSWSEKETDGQTSLFKLAHGAASLNDEYQNLPHGTARLDDESDHPSLLVHDWMQKSKTGILSDFVIGTVDQGLMMSLNHKHFMLKHLGMASKTIILDEVHAYDSYMSVFFDEMLEWLGSYRVPVLLLSATLPQARKETMIQSYLKGWAGKNQEVDESWKESLKTKGGYPLITWTDGTAVRAESISESEKDREKIVEIRKIPFSDPDMELDRIKEITQEVQKEGCCEAIIVNTVRDAQRTADFLRKQFPDLRVILFHSRYTRQRRAEIESEILKLAGKESRSEERKNLVIVGTQVLEQSLDLDFDCLITELAPMDLILQRIGRLHRHSRSSRPQECRLPACYVLIPPEKKERNYGIYESWYMIQTRKFLPDRLVLPRQIPSLVESIYSAALEAETPEEERAWDQMETRRHEKIGKAKTILLKPSSLSRWPGLDGLMKAGSLGDETRAKNSVRDGENSLDLILLQKDPQGEIRVAFDKNSEVLNPAQKMNPDLRARIARQRISIPWKKSPEEAAELLEDTQLIFSGWKKDPEFRYELFVLIDEEGIFQLGSDTYQYSEESGLIRL